MSIITEYLVKERELAEMKFLSKPKKDTFCALFNCGCRGRTEFRREFEAFLCDRHVIWMIRKNWSSYE